MVQRSYQDFYLTDKKTIKGTEAGFKRPDGETLSVPLAKVPPLF